MTHRRGRGCESGDRVSSSILGSSRPSDHDPHVGEGSGRHRSSTPPKADLQHVQFVPPLADGTHEGSHYRGATGEPVISRTRVTIGLSGK